MTGKTFRNLMLDIETLGSVPYSCILSIAAVEFDINTGNTGKEFYRGIDLKSCLDMGLIVNASTIMWWMQQNEQAREELATGNKPPIKQALNEFSSFCDNGYEIWGNSARFDCGILQNAYNKADIPIPWDFRKERCVRTLVSFKPDIKANYPFHGTAHNALHNCYFQVGYCSKTWRYLNNIEYN